MSYILYLLWSVKLQLLVDPKQFPKPDGLNQNSKCIQSDIDIAGKCQDSLLR